MACASRRCRSAGSTHPIHASASITPPRRSCICSGFAGDTEDRESWLVTRRTSYESRLTRDDYFAAVRAASEVNPSGKHFGLRERDLLPRHMLVERFGDIAVLDR